MNKFKKLFLLLSVITIVMVSLMVDQEQNVIIIYSSQEQYRGEELQRQLNEHFPSDKIVVKYISTGKVVARINEEKLHTEADIIVGLDTAYMEKIKDYMADLSNQHLEHEYLNEFSLEKNDYRYITWEKSAGSLVINTEVLKERNLSVPETYEDLLKPEYKNLIAMPNPKTSGTGYFFYKSIVNKMGEEKAIEYFDSLNENIKIYTESGSGPIKLLIQGEIAIGFALTFQAVDEINQGMPFEIIFPDGESPFNLTGTSVVKGRQDNEKVMEIFDYIANEFFYYDKMYFSPERILVEQENKIENYPKDINYADMKGISDIDEKERLLELWKY